MTTARKFRFGVQASTARTGAEWAEQARKVEGLGYSLQIPGAVLVHEVVLACDGAPIVVRVLARAGAANGADALQSGATLPIG